MRVFGPASNPVGWNCTISMSRNGSPAASAIAKPSQLLSPDGVWYLYIVGPPPVASSAAFACTKTYSPLRMSTRSEPARPYLLGEPVHDLDAGEVALVHRAIETLPGEGLLMDRPVRVAIEEAAELVFQLAHALDRAV